MLEKAKITLVITSLLLLTMAMLSGCRGSQIAPPSLESVPNVESPATKPPITAPQQVAFDHFIPSPTELTADLPPNRQTSYVETDLIQHGKDFQATMPNHNVLIDGNNAHFDAKYWSVDGFTFDNLAYCSYLFEATGYDRQAQINYGWETPILVDNNIWLGLSDWDKNSWTWYRGDFTSSLELLSLDPYFDAQSRLIVVFVMADVSFGDLRYVRLGPPTVFLDYTMAPAVSLAPFDVHFDLSGATTDAGTIDNYGWDFDGDGNYDMTSNGPTMDHTYSDPGEFVAEIFAENSYGVRDYSSPVIKALAPWAHSWGLGGSESIAAIKYVDEYSIYAVGTIDNGANGQDLLLLSYQLTGHLEWAMTWGGADLDRGMDIVSDGTGGIFVAGMTYSFGAGDSDVFLQHWTGGGNLNWTKTWGGADFESDPSISMSGGVYLVCNTFSFAHPAGDLALLKYDDTGNLVWQRLLGGTSNDSASDLKAAYSIVSQSTSVHIAGETESYVASGRGPLYARFTEDGDLSVLRSADVLPDLNIRAISVSGLIVPEIYLAGTIFDNDIDLFLLEMSTAPDRLVKGWDSGSDDLVIDLMRAGDSLLVCGWTSSGGPPDSGLLASFSLGGAFEGGETWSAGGEDCSLTFLQSCPVGGILIGGNGYQAVGGSWSQITGTLYDPAGIGAWGDNLGMATVPSGMEGSPGAAAVDVTDGVIDTGGGNSDALLLMRRLP